LEVLPLVDVLKDPKEKPKPKRALAPRLLVEGVTKTFPGVVAVDDVSIEILPGEIHAMVGENGAGKSTLMHMVAGVYKPDKGSMQLDGEPYAPADETAAQKAGVAMVFQEGSLFPPLSISENIFAGRQPVNHVNVIDFNDMRKKTRDLLRDLDVDVDPSTRIASLSPGQKQLVEIAKALSQQVRLLILDEPTSSLSINESRNLFGILKRLARRGVAIIYVTHRLAEVFEVADRVTVLKDGKVTGVREIKKTNSDELIRLEVGRELSFAPSKERTAKDAPVALEIEDLVASPVKHASLTVKAGEIVCLAGLVGAGRTELCQAIFGLRKRESGHIRVNGVELDPHHPRDAMQMGVGMVTEDRREGGLFMPMSILLNVSAANLEAVSRGGIVRDDKVTEISTRFAEKLRIATTSLNRQVMYLSGGNQQKVLLARWLAREPKVLIVDEPTRGVDVGAKSDLYEILRGLAREGVALLVVSSDLPEVLALAHRIVVMSEGLTVGELDARNADEVTILQMATPKSAVHQGE
jgi:ABC-type sugar transport system ATPase subunit